ncbi:hypothetical protein V6N13_033586 [Hibiscus sabdariffa]
MKQELLALGEKCCFEELLTTVKGLRMHISVITLFTDIITSKGNKVRHNKWGIQVIDMSINMFLRSSSLSSFYYHPLTIGTGFMRLWLFRLNKEVFEEVEPWTEAYRIPERVTWIQVSGIPLHCWNDTTFNRIATVWGSLLALGENANQSIDCDKITMLVSTRLRENLTKVIELEVARESFLISIVELGFQITSSKIEKEKTRQKLPSSPEDSSSGTSSSISPMSNGKVTCSKEVEVSLDCCMGNTFKVGVTLNDVNERRLVGEDAILGSCQLVQKVSKEMSHSWPEREKETVENLNKVDQSRLEGATSGSESDQQDDLLVEKVNQYSQPRDIVQKDVEEEGLVGQKENLSTSKCSRRLAGLARLLWCWSWFVE